MIDETARRREESYKHQHPYSANRAYVRSWRTTPPSILGSNNAPSRLSFLGRIPDGTRRGAVLSTCFDFSASRRRTPRPRLTIELKAYASASAWPLCRILICG